jgi:hypothetical protein
LGRLALPDLDCRHFAAYAAEVLAEGNSFGIGGIKPTADDSTRPDIWLARRNLLVFRSYFYSNFEPHGIDGSAAGASGSAIRFVG